MCSIEEINELWDTFDKNKDGVLDVNEVVKMVKQICDKKKQTPPSDRCIYDMILDLDTSGDFMISKDEFIKDAIEKPNRREAMTELFKEKAGDDNCLSLLEIENVVTELGCFKEPAKVAQNIMKENDTDKNGTVSLDEFLICLC